MSKNLTPQISALDTFLSFSEQYKPEFDVYLASVLSASYTDKRQLLADSMNYSCINKGKRVRPLLSIASALLFEENVQDILPFSAALEMIHTYSLIHDDLPAMDNDDFRRGQPTNHKRFGEDMAILAGDCLLTLAFEVMSTQLSPQFDAKEILASIQYLSKECGQIGLIGGQVLDINHEGTSEESTLKKIHKLKTGALIKTAIVVPALLYKADPKQITLLEEFGKKIGLLFQIVDDILDVTQTSEALGKTANKDLEQNKLTYVRLYGLDKSKELVRETATEALDTLEKLTLDTKALTHFVRFFSDRTF
ncbi:farnesyl-diphosphate synthase [Candidatus Marinamargulisbacteria bacterium SCGC AAA071-K20]|nr:farnesyl-diphosphate synthase [Candidatus Marinamargulisbacteria bacterium SCGC AAA071-K20]